VYVLRIRMRVSAPFGTGLSSVTRRNSASSAVSAPTPPDALASRPFTVANLSGWPVARSMACSFEAVEPCRMGFKKVGRAFARNGDVVDNVERVRGGRKQLVNGQFARGPRR